MNPAVLNWHFPCHYMREPKNFIKERRISGSHKTRRRWEKGLIYY